MSWEKTSNLLKSKGHQVPAERGSNSWVKPRSSSSNFITMSFMQQRADRDSSPCVLPPTALIQSQTQRWWPDSKQRETQFWRSHFSHLILLILSQEQAWHADADHWEVYPAVIIEKLPLTTKSNTYTQPHLLFWVGVRQALSGSLAVLHKGFSGSLELVCESWVWKPMILFFVHLCQGGV